jgi:uncharacterized protein (TIGR02996 family)
MSMADNFFQAVLASPESTEPRLQYAAWLDERCDPLGEFIRVQCLLARLPISDASVLELERREHELLAEHEYEWADRMADLVDFWVFRRGFIEEVGLSAESFLEHAETLFNLAPLQEVHLTRINGHLAELTEVPELRLARFLDLSNNSVRDSGARLLARSGQLSQLHGLNLSCTGLGDAGARAIAGTPHLAHLHELYLSANHIGDVGGKALATTPQLRQLAALHLDYNDIGQDGVSALRRRFGERVRI